MGYEVTQEMLEGYSKVMLESPRDTTCERWGTYQEKYSMAIEQLYSCTRKRKVENMVEKIAIEGDERKEEWKKVKKMAQYNYSMEDWVAAFLGVKIGTYQWNL